ncbi:MAG: GNAT family N-acetyltransferase [Actinobacteria bacterium]|nr:GNAT family N-acetyltransferase [Actinomycetota bacterium]
MVPPLPVDVVVLEPDDLPAALALLSRVWGLPPGTQFVELHMARALLLAGEPLLGAYHPGRAHDPDALVGASVGFVGTHPGGLHVHSHATGIDPVHQHAGVGAAMKRFQRAWALDRGIAEIRWTFDPLIARNAYFNLTKLGAVGAAYLPDVYGAMGDPVNGTDPSDRVEARWDLTAADGRPDPDLDALVAGGAEVILSLDGEVWRGTRLVPTLLACVPRDIVALRRTDPAAARRWRLAARDTIGRALDLGYGAVGATRDGWWVLQAGAGGAAGPGTGAAVGNEAE